MPTLRGGLGFLSDRLLGDNPLIIMSKLCSHNFSEKPSVRGTIRAGFPDGMADRFPESWGQGLEPRGTGPTLAINDSNAKFNLSACPIHLHQASPGSKGQGKGRPPKGQGRGIKSSPGERKNPNLKPKEERAEATTEEVKCPKCPKNLQLDHQSGLPLVRLQASPGECPQSRSKESHAFRCRCSQGTLCLATGNSGCFRLWASLSSGHSEHSECSVSRCP